LPSGTGKNAAAEVIDEVEIAAIGSAGDGVGYVQAGPSSFPMPRPAIACCGSCNLQQLSEPAYRFWKQGLVAGA
jgi:hypothetical protein